MTTYFYEPSHGSVLNKILEGLRPGDALRCRHVSDLAATWGELKKLLDKFKDGCRLEVAYSSGKAGEPMETVLRRDLRRAAIARARATGSYKHCGRPPKVDRAEVRQLAGEGKRPAAIAEELGVSLPTVYRALATA